jgi:2-methylcitrate dehydratase PrpD
MSAKTITQELASFAVETQWGDLPESIVQETKQVLMEHIGVGLAALSTDKGKLAAAIGRRLGGPPESSIIGLGDKVSCSSAVLANGELMITLDYHANMSFGHDGLFIIPPALAMAEIVNASGKDLILATVVGLEISSRLARAAGWHMVTPEDIRRQQGKQAQHKNAHSNFGAAATAGRLLKLDKEKMLHALGIAGRHCDMTLTSGVGEGGSNKGMTKYVVPGWQNTGAVISALLAEMGYIGDTAVLDDPKRMNWYPDEITEELGKTWIFNQQLHYKPYPCCGAFHNSMDCFYNIVEQNNLMPDEIESVRIFGGMMGRPGAAPLSLPEKEEALESIYAAQFNVPYNFALLAYRVRRGVEWADSDTRRNPEILKFMDKVTSQADPEAAKQWRTEREKDPRVRPARVAVMARGKTFTNEIRYRRGDSFTDVYWTQEDAIGKFQHNTERILTKGKIERATEVLLELEKLNSVSQLVNEITL